MKKSLLLTAFFLPLATSAQSIRTAGTFAYTRFTAYSTGFADAFSYSGNTAALAGTKNLSAGVYSERRFGLKELGTHAAAVVLPTGSGRFGLRADYLGSTSYNESSLGLAYSRQLGSKVALGVQFNYYALTAAGYDAASAINADLGILVQLAPQLKAGVQACNPVGTSWSKTGIGSLPAIYRAGLGYDASPQFFISAEAEKVENESLGLNAAMQYVMAEKVVARAGIRSATAVYYLGFGVSLRNFRVDVTASIHPYLGLTPGLLLLYAAGK